MPGTKTIGQMRRPLWLFILCVMVSAWTWNVSNAVMLAEAAVNVFIGFFVMSCLSLEFEIEWCGG